MDQEKSSGWVGSDMQKYATHATEGRRVAEKSERLWKFFSKFKQKYNFQQAQGLFWTQNDLIKLIL